MAFLLHSIDGSAKISGIEYLPAGAITPKAGMALVQSSGKLAVCTGASAKPTYISMIEKSAACTSGDIIPVIRVLPDMIFETTLSASGTSLNLGDKVQVASGIQVNATTSNGVAEIVEFPTGSQASGAKVRVRFS